MRRSQSIQAAGARASTFFLSRVIILAVFMLLALSVAEATTYHVTANDKNGDASVDQNGTCPNHPQVGSAWVSCSTSIASNCSLDQPCCDIQTALDKATRPGDVVEVHAGTYDFALDGPATSFPMQGVTMQAMNEIRHCSGCTSEADRRIIRGAVISSQDKPVVKAATTSGVEFAFLFGKALGDNVRFVTLSNFEIVGFDPGAFGGLTRYFGLAVQNKGDSSYAIIEKLHIHDTGADGTGAAKYSCAIGVGGCSGEQFSGDCVNSDHVIIQDNRVGPNHDGCVIGEGSAGNACLFQGNIIRRNDLETQIDVGAGVGWRMKGFCGVVYDNYYHGTGSNNNEIHFRDNFGGFTYFFNNFFEGDTRDDLFYLQLDSGEQSQVKFFNNTIRGGSAWDPLEGGGFTSSSLFVNNLHIENSVAMGGGSCSSPSVGVAGFNAFEGSFTNCTINTNLGNNVTGGFPHTLGSGARPQEYYGLRSGSSVIGAGTNDPLGQGAGICVINMESEFSCGSASSEACAQIDCSLDFDGDERGQTWDIGADEFTTELAGSVPPPSGIRRGEGEGL